MSKKYFLYVHNTMTGKTEKVEVTKEVYIVYRRTEWNIKDNNKSFYKHEIQFSALGQSDEHPEKFHEFMLESKEFYDDIEKQMLIDSLHIALRMLDKKDIELITSLYVIKKTEKEYATEIGISQQTIHKKKKRILKKLKKFLN